MSPTLVTFLSWLGIPASFVVIATMSIVGLGWERATTRRPDPTNPAADLTDPPADVAVDSGLETDSLFRPTATARVVFMQNLVPFAATVGAYLVFSRFGPAVGV